MQSAATLHADPGQSEMVLGMRYLRAIEQAGAIPVVVPPLRRPGLEALLDRVDGICLSGVRTSIRWPTTQSP